MTFSFDVCHILYGVRKRVIFFFLHLFDVCRDSRWRNDRIAKCTKTMVEMHGLIVTSRVHGVMCFMFLDYPWITRTKEECLRLLLYLQYTLIYTYTYIYVNRDTQKCCMQGRCVGKTLAQSLSVLRFIFDSEGTDRPTDRDRVNTHKPTERPWKRYDAYISVDSVY